MKIPTTPEELVEFLKEQNLTARIADFKLTAPGLDLIAFGLNGSETVNIELTLICNPPEGLKIKPIDKTDPIFGFVNENQ